MRMKKSYIGALLLFVIVIGAIALLSKPEETTWIALYLDSKKLNQAENLLMKRYQSNPNDLENAARLVDTLEALKKDQHAKKIAQDVLQNNPDNVYWKHKLASIMLSENDPISAASILPPQDRDSEFWRRLAHGYHSILKEDLAEKALFSGYETDNPEAWRTLAQWRAERMDLQGEKVALENALKLAPEDENLISRYFFNRISAGDEHAAQKAAVKLPKPLARKYLEALFGLYNKNKDYPEAKKILSQLLARHDTTVADSLAMVSILYLQNELQEAQEILDKLEGHSSSFSQAEKNALVSQLESVRSAMLIDAAQKGNENVILKEIEKLSATPKSSILRNLIYACLRLSDFFEKVAENTSSKDQESNLQKAKSRFWVKQAQTLYTENKDRLPLTDLANAHLIADLAERNEDWHTMIKAWNTIAKDNASDLQALLGTARAYQHLGNYEASWQNLLKAEHLVKDDADLLTIALQAQALVDTLPDDYPSAAILQGKADVLAHKSLAKTWNNTLALNLFFRALQTNNLSEADNILHSLESKGLATPQEYLGVAEAQLALSLHSSKQNNKTSFGAMRLLRERAAQNALKAYGANIPDLLPRLLYIYTELNDKQKVQEIVQRMKNAEFTENPNVLRQLSEAYGFLGNYRKQAELLEKRAKLSGKLRDWEDAIDRYYWNKEYKEALRLLDNAETNYPYNANLIDKRIILLGNMGQSKRVLDVFHKAQEYNPEISKKMSANCLAELGIAYDKDNQFERAHHFFNLSLAKDPVNYRSVFGFAELAKRNGKTEEAASLLNKFLEYNPHNLWARAELADLRPIQGKRQYENILANAPAKTSAEEKAVLALALWRTKHYKEAIKIYSELMKEPKRTPAMMCDYAQMLMDADKLEDARKVLDQVIREFPKDVLARRLLGAIYIRQKEYATAETCLRDALELSPGNKEISRELAHVLQAQKKFWSAQKSLFDAGKR